VVHQSEFQDINAFLGTAPQLWCLFLVASSATLQEQYVMDVVGALEYDPELKGPQPHRSFLNTSVAFKEVRIHL
jgi:hypothetical protein